MKKILILSLTYHPFIGGAEVAVKEITDRLSDHQFDMVTVNLDGKQVAEEKIGNVRVHRIGKGYLSKYFFPWQAKKKSEELHLQNHYDGIWAIMANQAGLAASWFQKKHPEVKFLLTLQEGDSEFDIWIRTFFIRSVYRAIYERADHIQAISKFLAERARKMGAMSQVSVVPNGVDVSKIQKIVNSKQNHGEKVIITASRLEKKNGLDTLIKGFGELVKKYKNPVRLVIVGDGSLRRELEGLTRRLQLEKQVDFVGKVSPDEVYKRLAGADIFVRPSRSEGLGNAFLEAMACNVPVIGTPVGGIPDFLKHRKTGLVCQVDDEFDLAEKMNQLLTDSQLYSELQAAGKTLVTEKYQWTGIAQKMNDILIHL